MTGGFVEGADAPARILYPLTTGEIMADWLRRVLFVVLALTGIPVVLLFFATAVPRWIAALLALAHSGILITLFSVERNLLTFIVAGMGLALIGWLAVRLSQRYATTPPIPTGIAKLEKIHSTHTPQWITIRGKDVQKPVLLYLAGGPGGSDLAWTRRYLSALEDHFVVVNWDQPGSAKSFGEADISTLTPEQYITDAHALVQYLRERFGQTKIYLMGHSWGSLLGVWLVQRYAECFHAYVSVSQLVDVTQNDVMGYQFALDYLEGKGETKAREKLQQQGPPPYRGGITNLRYAAYAAVLLRYMNEKAQGRPVLSKDALLAPEYGLLDKVNLFQGGLQTFNRIYPQLEQVNLMTEATELKIPVYFALGRWDVNVMASLAEDYFQQLAAPYKERLWFEESGHLPHYEESARFVQFMVERVLRERLYNASSD